MDDLTPGDGPRFLGFIFQSGPETPLVPLDQLTVLYGLNGAGKTRTMSAIRDLFAGMRGNWDGGLGNDPLLALVQLGRCGSERNMSWWATSRSNVSRQKAGSADEGEQGLLDWVGHALQFGNSISRVPIEIDPDRLAGLVAEWSRQRLVLISALPRSEPEWVSWPAVITGPDTHGVNREVALEECKSSDELLSSRDEHLGRVEGVLPNGRRVFGLCGSRLAPTSYPALPGLVPHTVLPNIGLRLTPQMDDVAEEVRRRLRFHAGFYFEADEIEWDVDLEMTRLSTPLARLRTEVEDLANANFGGVLQDAPALRLSVNVSGFDAGVQWWVQPDETEDPFLAGGSRSLEQLSSAEKKWADWAIRYAIAKVLPINEDLPPAWAVGVGADPDVDWTIEFPFPVPSLELIDEPERALHRTAEARMAAFLRRVATPDHRLLIATHSPELLDAKEATVIEVRRRPGHAPLLSPLTHANAAVMSDLGLTPSDLLRRQRGFLLVEGQHDLDVLKIVLGDELQRLGVDVLPLRGATQLSAARGRFLFEYTDAHVFVMLDNLHTQKVADAWVNVRAARMSNGMDAARSTLADEFAAKHFGKGTEVRILTEFLSASLDSDDWTRVTPFGLTEGDIIEYLPVRHLVPGRRSWSELREDFQQELADSRTQARNFKSWLSSRGATITDELVRQAARSLDDVPIDIQRLLKTIDATLDRS